MIKGRFYILCAICLRPTWSTEWTGWDGDDDDELQPTLSLQAAETDKVKLDPDRIPGVRGGTRQLLDSSEMRNIQLLLDAKMLAMALKASKFVYTADVLTPQGPWKKCVEHFAKGGPPCMPEVHNL